MITLPVYFCCQSITDIRKVISVQTLSVGKKRKIIYLPNKYFKIVNKEKTYFNQAWVG